MKKLTRNDWPYILSGANLLATGGGGTVAAGATIVKKIHRDVPLVSLKELRDSDVVCTVFGIGGKQNCNPTIASKRSFSLFQEIYKKRVAALVPVETGAMAIANTAFIADTLHLPLLDSDIVGLRSSPEVYLETITLANLSRTPCVIADDKGNSAALFETTSLEQLETFLRNFATSVGGDAFITGYPLKASQLKTVVSDGSISISRKNGNYLQMLRKSSISLERFCDELGWKLFDRASITTTTLSDTTGFAQGTYTIRSKEAEYRLFYKNENIVLLKNNTPLLTSPDSITLLDLKTFQGINNFEKNDGKMVAILGRKAIPIWRTKEGKKLFSPKRLGFPYRQKLIV